MKSDSNRNMRRLNIHRYFCPEQLTPSLRHGGVNERNLVRAQQADLWSANFYYALPLALASD